MNIKKNVCDYKYAICISGAASGETVEQSGAVAKRLGAAIARRGHTIITGATIGLPYMAALGAYEQGGLSIGFSPASSIREHLRKYRLPCNAFDHINFTGMNYIGRDFQLVTAADAMIVVGGRFGTLNEFTIALEMRKPLGILLNSGGTADLAPSLLKVLDPPKGQLIFQDESPEALVDALIDALDAHYKDVREDMARAEKWFGNTDSSGHSG